MNPKDLKFIFNGPLSKEAIITKPDGRQIKIRGYPAAKAFERSLDGKFVAKSQRLIWTALTSQIQDVSNHGDVLTFEGWTRDIVSILPNPNGTSTIETREEIESEKGSESGDGSNSSHGFE